MIMVVSGPTRARMRLAVSTPSMSGIFQSIMAMSKCLPSSSRRRTSSTALNPESTQRERAPAFSRMDVAWLPTSGSSSATSTASPCSSSRFFLWFSTSWSSSASLKGRITVNTEPFFLSLSTSMLPPMSWTRLYTMESPRPLPTLLRAVSGASCSNGMNRRLRNSLDIPIPVSFTWNRR